MKAPMHGKLVAVFVRAGGPRRGRAAARYRRGHEDGALACRTLGWRSDRGGGRARRPGRGRRSPDRAQSRRIAAAIAPFHARQCPVVHTPNGSSPDQALRRLRLDPGSRGLDRGKPCAASTAEAALRADAHDPDGSQARRRDRRWRLALLGRSAASSPAASACLRSVRSRIRMGSGAVIWCSSRWSIRSSLVRFGRSRVGAIMEAKDAPRDLGQDGGDVGQMPESLRRELADLGLI